MFVVLIQKPSNSFSNEAIKHVRLRLGRLLSSQHWKSLDIAHVNCWVANLVTIRGQSPIFWSPKSFELQKFRHWTLNNGLLKLGIRFRTLDFRFWTTDFGLWSTKQYYALYYSLSTNLVTIDEGRSSSRLRSESSTVRFVSSQHFFAINKTSTITRSVGQTNYFFWIW